MKTIKFLFLLLWLAVFVVYMWGMAYYKSTHDQVVKESILNKDSIAYGFTGQTSDWGKVVSDTIEKSPAISKATANFPAKIDPANGFMQMHPYIPVQTDLVARLPVPENPIINNYEITMNCADLKAQKKIDSLLILLDSLRKQSENKKP